MRWGWICLLLVAGCARAVPPQTRAAYADLVVADTECRAAGPELVEPAALARDVRVLERVLRRGYAGFESAADEHRWTEVFGELRASVPPQPTSPRAFRDLLLEHITFVDDAHVGLWVYEPRRHWRSTTRHRQAWVAAGERLERSGDGYVDQAGLALVSCGGEPAEAVLRPTTGDAPPSIDYVPVVLSAEEPPPLVCTFADGSERTVPLTRLNVRGARGAPFEMGEAPFPWLRLRTLFTDHRGALERFVATAPTVRDAPVVVLDLRRAGGGSDVFLFQWFRALTAQPIHYWETDRLASETTLQGALTFWGCVRGSLTSRSDEAGRAWLDARVARAQRELDEAMNERGLFRERTRESRVLDGRAPVPFAGRLLLVVDRGCGSACETSVLLARQIPGALVVGENTEGAMKVGELRHYRLPESRVWISLGMRAHHDPDGRFEESRGFLPDLWLHNDDPDHQIAELAACLAEPACAATLTAPR